VGAAIPLWLVAKNSDWELALSILSTVAIGLGLYWMLAALIPLWPFPLAHGATTGEGERSVGGVRPILLPDTATYQRADHPGWWFASCEWRIPGESGAIGNPAVRILRAAFRERWHRRTIDAEPGMIQTRDDYLFIPFPPHYDNDPKNMRGRVTLIDNNGQYYHYRVVFRISNLGERIRRRGRRQADS
jgi:hypothetical protein